MAAMPPAPLILLPPSEGKQAGGTSLPWAPGRGAFPELDERRVTVAAALVQAMRGSVAARHKLLGVKGEALATATATNAAVLEGPTLPAIERYTGVLYAALDPASLPARDRRRLGRQVVIFSGLWGATLPGDPLPDHKLKMAATLPRLGKLSTWWRTPLTDALAPMVEGRVVWDLLPNEHDAAWAPPEPGTAAAGAPASVLAVRFLDELPPTRRGAPRSFTTVNHWNKLLKGALVRHVLATGADEPDALAGFAHPEGYVYDASLTEEAKGRTVVSMVRPPR
jgi:cytoplasmic iron level regulating protein YaaA (DUF328/UPF0246 family)